MQLSFSKMHGLGNDFVLLDGVRTRIDISPALIKRLGDRHFGIGCDQVLLVQPSSHPDADFNYRIFNADGSEAQQCGNGSRCVARYLRDEKLINNDEVTVATINGLIRMYLLPDHTVKVDMGCPRFTPAEIPMLADIPADSYAFELSDTTVRASALSMGNPHAVITVSDVDGAPVATLGPQMGSHPRFPEGVNVGFMQIVDAQHIRLRVYERGAGETLACGTGACAAVVAGQLTAALESTVEVSLPGGQLTIQWAGRGSPVWMTGPAERVFDGSFRL